MSNRSLTVRPISINVLTASYRICGITDVTNTGLMGLVNDATSGFMELRQASMARIHMPDKLVKKIASIRLVKKRIHAICLENRRDIGPQALARGGFERIKKYHVEITNPIYEYQGFLEWSGRFDFSTIMVEGNRDFVPLYESRVRAVMLPNVKLKSPAILFNRELVDSLCITKKSVTKKS